MTSVLSRFSDASATCLMCSGRLSRPAACRSRIELEAELGGDHHLVAEGRQGLAHQFFVGERTVHFRGVEEGDAAFDGRPNQRDLLLLVDGRAEPKLMPMQPSPRAETSRLLFPSLRFCMIAP